MSGKRPVSPSLDAGTPGRQLCLSLSNHCGWASLFKGNTYSSEHLMWCFETLLFSDSRGESVTVNEHCWFPLMFSLACNEGDGCHLIYNFLEKASLYMNLLWCDWDSLFFLWNFLFLGTPVRTAPANAWVACHILWAPANPEYATWISLRASMTLYPSTFSGHRTSGVDWIFQ